MANELMTVDEITQEVMERAKELSAESGIPLERVIRAIGDWMTGPIPPKRRRQPAQTKEG